MQKNIAKAKILLPDDANIKPQQLRFCNRLLINYFQQFTEKYHSSMQRITHGIERQKHLPMRHVPFQYKIVPQK